MRSTKPVRGRPPFSPISVGRRLEQIRNDLGMNIEEFSSGIGVPRMTYYNYKNGKFFPSVEILGLLRKHYNLSADFLLFGDRGNDQGNRRTEKSY